VRNLWWVAGLLVAVLVVVFLAPLASPDPDGLERVAQEGGFIDTGQAALIEILPDYSVPGVTDGGITTIVAGLIGVGIVFLLMWGLGALLARRRRAADKEL
jgi:hypothetical protein